MKLIETFLHIFGSLYEIAFLKIKNVNKNKKKTFIHLLQSVKQKSKKNYDYNLLATCENEMKGTWGTIK